VLKICHQYASFKPLVNRKLKKPATIRQFVPPLFVLFLLFGWAAAFIHPSLIFIYICGAGLYLGINILFTIKSAWEQRKGSLLLYLPWIFFMQHLVYGIGYLAGIINFVFIKKSQTVIKASR
jgi:hypothetical protein